MDVIKIDKIEYYNSTDIIKKCPYYSKGCRSSRDLVRIKTILPNNYVFAKQINDKWIKSCGKSRKYDKIFLKKEYIDNIKKLKKELVEESSESDDSTDSTDSDDDGDVVIKKAPEILKLSDEEKLQDDKGNILEIETRGERDSKKIFFRVHDVAKGFDMKTLYSTIINNQNKNSYLIDIDYKYFFCPSQIINDIQKYKKELFLTYAGLLRVLFVSRNTKVDDFVDEEIKKMFTMQMGSITDKTKLAAKILGTDADIVSDVFNKDCRGLSCIYGFTLGFVKDLRKSMNIDKKYNDLDFVLKFGQTNALSRRTNEHKRTYGSISGCDLKLKYYAPIDVLYKSKAEVEIKNYFKELDCFFKYKDHVELVILTKQELINLKNIYGEIGTKYAGHISELIIKIKSLEDNIEDLQKDIINIKKTCKKNIEYEKEICKKNIEIEKMNYKKDLEYEKMNYKKDLEYEKMNYKKDLDYEKEICKNDIEKANIKYRIIEYEINSLKLQNEINVLKHNTLK
jgi:hypothetical protein